MELGADKALAGSTRSELREVGRGPRDNVLLQLEHDAAERGGGVAAAELDVEEDLGVVLFVVVRG